MNMQKSIYHHLLFFVAAICLVLTTASCSDSVIDIDGSGSSPEDLYGTSWELTTFVNEKGGKVDLNPEETYELTFNADLGLGGRADCNSYGANYMAKDGGEINIEDLITTKVGCGKDSHIDEFYEALANSTEYEVKDQILKLGFGSKGILVFRKQ